MAYKIKLEVFEGPLDLLLYLIKKDHINVYDIPIAEVTKQYLKYLELMKLLNLDIVGEFLVMAATLMQIKSRMLLPQEESQIEEGQEEDPRAELVKRLLEYKKFKEAAGELRQRELSRQDIFTRPSDKLLDQIGGDSQGYFEANLFDLISAFSKALKDIPKEVFYEVIKDEFTVDQKIHDILHILLIKPTISLTELFNKAKNKLEIIANFLAVLELIRLKEIVILQKTIFGEIEILRNKNNISPYARKTE
ncbi:MAG: segregation/condensation protein A [Candidatus Atribacteria bacterium]|nr:segregation/condensation protein A [Candidatus Atribacteria bacterium]